MVCVGALAAVAQDCPLPPVLQPLPAGIDILSDKQESDLGDAVAEQIGPRRAPYALKLGVFKGKVAFRRLKYRYTNLACKAVVV
jgi:hypothetical protein